MLASTKNRWRACQFSSLEPSKLIPIQKTHTVDPLKLVPASYFPYIISVIVPAFAGLLWWAMKRAFKAAADKLESVEAKVTEIHKVTSVQAENHLSTVQAEAVKQTALLETMIKEQATTNGYLKAVVEIAKK
jgi:hypothetical protein